MKDKELEKLQGIINRLEELGDFFNSGGFSDKERERMKRYIAHRYRYFFDWIKEVDERYN